MPKLNDIKGIAEKPAKKSAKQVPVKVVAGELIGKVAKYNAAADRAKAAQAEMTEIAPVLQAEGLEYVFEHNCACRDNTKLQIKSVNLTEPVAGDAEPEKLQFTWTSRAGKCNRDVVKAHFDGLTTLAGTPADMNKYADYVVVAEFDKEVFVDAKGKFMQVRFDRFKKAMDAVSAELGIENPLTFYKEFKATAEVSDLRFQEFDLEQNLALQLVLPTATALKPIRSNGEED
jgi:hypothetical protein